jgi:hypothetical protein
LSSITQPIISPESIPPSYVESPVTLYNYPLPPPPLPHKSGEPPDVDAQVDPTPSVPATPEAKLSVKVIPKAASLIPPPQINFDSVPIPFKGIPLEAAQWTFDSAELQEVVSRAIRLSARESFIRVVSIETLDRSIVDEHERLATLKLTTQSKYRFQVHRRTMLLQALNSSALGTPDPSTISNLAVQLSETSAQCDRLMEELLQVSDQQSQLTKVQDLHFASALAIALRKINKSYERKVTELRGAQERIEILEAELEDAWKEAERVAKEIDELEGGMSDFDGDEGDEGYGDEVTMHAAHMVGVTGKAVATSARLLFSLEPTDLSAPNTSAPTISTSKPSTPGSSALQVSTPDASEAIASVVPAEEASETQATRSNTYPSRRNSERRSRWGRVTAARTRSQRTSNASLRVTKRSLSRAGRTSEDRQQPPPVPHIHIPGNTQPNSFLDLNNNTQTQTSTAQEGNGGFSLVDDGKLLLSFINIM